MHSVYRPGSYLTGGYWDDFLVLPMAGQLGVPQRIAILGDAAGTVARAYGHYFPTTRVDAVELDGELTRIGRRYFGLGGPEPAYLHRRRAPVAGGQQGHATTRSSSTPTASPTSRSTWSRESSLSRCARTCGRVEC